MTGGTGRARRASAVAVLLATTAGFTGAGGWSAGGTGVLPAPEPPVTVEPHDTHRGHHGTAESDPPPAAVADAHHAHHQPQGEETPQAAPAAAGGHGAHHGHDCKNGVCRCDSRCPSRRSRPCGDALSPCSGTGDDAAGNPGPVRPFVLPTVLRVAQALEGRHWPDVTIIPVACDLVPASPPPRASSLRIALA
jgi:hypothetical protein